MDWLTEYTSWCKSFADNYTEVNIDTSGYINLANSVGGQFARCFIDKAKRQIDVSEILENEL